MGRLLAAALILGAILVAPTAYAAQCRDTQGKFMKCPAKPVHCRDNAGKFVKCSAPGAKPA
jgi:hypothetical protein